MMPILVGYWGRACITTNQLCMYGLNLTELCLHLLQCTQKKEIAEVVNDQPKVVVLGDER